MSADDETEDLDEKDLDEKDSDDETGGFDDEDFGDEDVADPFTQQRPERQPPRKVLPGLASVDWGALEQAYGDARGVPGMIDAISSPDPEDRAWALEALDACIYHQGSVYSASVAAVPFLVELAREPWLEVRPQLLDLLCGMAVHDPDACVAQGSRRYRSEAYQAILASASAYLDLLAEPEAAVRISAARLLAYLEPPPRGAIESIMQAMARESDEHARASLLLALGYVSRYLEDRSAEALLTVELTSELRLLRAAAAIGLHQMRGTDAPELARAVLARTPSEATQVEGHFPWMEGDIGRFARVIRAAFETDVERFCHIDRAMMEGATRESENAAVRLFGSLFQDELHGYDRPWLPAELDAPRRKLLEYYLATTPKEGDQQSMEFWEVAGSSGLFASGRDIEGLLGKRVLILDRLVRLGEEERPLWAWIIATNGGIAPASLLPILNDWSPADRIAVAEAVLEGAYRLTTPRWHTEYGEDDDHPHSPDRANDYTSRCLLLLAEILGTHDACLTWAEQLAQAQAALGEDRAAKKAVVAALVVTQAQRFPSELEALIACDQAPATTYQLALRVILERMPVERATPLVVTEPLYGYYAHVDPRGEVRRWHNGKGWERLKLAPPKLRVAAVLGAFEEWERHLAAGTDRQAEPVIGRTESTILIKPGGDEAFPREQATELLASAGAVAVEAIDDALANRRIRDVEFLTEARRRALN